MIRHNSIIITLTALFVSLVLVSTSLAQDTLLISYQGRLTDDGGNPVNGTPSMTFTIYDGTGVSKWAETHPTVQVDEGLFNVILGSQTALPVSVFTGDDRYLGITVGGDPEISPRTLLTASPRAAIASKLLGDIQTSNDALIMKNEDGDSSIVMNRSIEQASIRLFDPQPEPPGKAIVDIAADLNLGASMKLFDPQPEPPGKTLELLSGLNSGASILMFDPQPEPPGHQRLEISSSAELGASIKMFDPQPEPPGKLFDINATTGSGPSMGFFDEAGQVMGVEPSPFNGGFSIVMFDPQPEPPGKLFEISTDYSSAKSSELNMFTVPLGGARQEIVTMSASGSTAELRMGTGAPVGGTESLILIKSDGTSSMIEVAGPAGGPTASPPIMMISYNTQAMVGVGTNSPNYNLDVRGTIGNNTTLYHSDKRWKKDIEHLKGSLDRVMKLQGVQYRWKKGEYPEMNFPDGEQIGLIAQDVEKIIPEVVNEAVDGYKSIDYAKLVSILIESIKEQQKQIEVLSKRVEELEGTEVSSR